MRATYGSSLNHKSKHRCNMFRSTVVRFLSFCLLASVWMSAFAEFSVYTIDNTLKAVFPQEPTFTGEAGTGTSRMRGYNYADQTNGIFYSANYSLNPIPYAENDIRKIIEGFVKGNLPGINGKLLRIDYTQHGSEQGAHYVINFTHQGIHGRKFSSVIFRGGRFFVWTVQDIPAISTLDANNIFSQYVKYFQLIR